MPSLSPYQGLQLTDERGVDAWVMAHWFRHQTYNYAASIQGVTVQDYNLQFWPDDTWFLNHANAHQTLLPFMNANDVLVGSVSMTDLTTYSWDNQSDFDAWMQMHTQIHQLLDEGFEIFDT
jgi:hypothetical protein